MCLDIRHDAVHSNNSFKKLTAAWAPISPAPAVLRRTQVCDQMLLHDFKARAAAEERQEMLDNRKALISVLSVSGLVNGAHSVYGCFHKWGFHFLDVLVTRAVLFPGLY